MLWFITLRCDIRRRRNFCLNCCIAISLKCNTGGLCRFQCITYCLALLHCLDCCGLTVDCTVHCVHCVPCTEEQHWGAGRWRTEKTQGGETPPRINRVGRQTNKQRVLYYCKKRWMFKEVAWCYFFPWPRDKQTKRKGATAVGDRAERRRRTIYLPMMRVYFFWKLWPRTKHDFFLEVWWKFWEMWKICGGGTWKATQGSETIKTIRAVVAVVNKRAVVNNESKYGYRSIYH